VGANTASNKMTPYVFSRTHGGVHIIDIGKTFDKIHLAARIFAAVKNPSNVCVVGGQEYAARAVMRFCQLTGAVAAPTHWVPGTLTNQITRQFMEPRLLIVCDPKMDAQAVRECAYSNITVVAFCNTNDSLSYVDVAIPLNHTSQKALALGLWALAREIIRVSGSLLRNENWD
uniref:Small ribosomal subunit protein uS2 n=1 Tax=Dermatophagoides pteronyssinus TaxID=6956 RepID=A0A6P6YKM2_DERPT